MGFRTVGRVAEGYNTANETMLGAQDEMSGKGQGFLQDWITNRLPEMVTGLAIRVVDDGSGTIAKEVLDAGTDKRKFNSTYKIIDIINYIFIWFI